METSLIQTDVEHWFFISPRGGIVLLPVILRRMKRVVDIGNIRITLLSKEVFISVPEELLEMYFGEEGLEQLREQVRLQAELLKPL